MDDVIGQRGYAGGDKSAGPWLGIRHPARDVPGVVSKTEEKMRGSGRKSEAPREIFF